MLAAAVTVTGILANVLVAPALPDIQVAFDASGAAVGAIVAFASLPGIVLAPALGFLADRFGRRTVLVPCLVVFGAGAIAVMAAPTLAFLLLGRFLQGCGSAGMVNLAVVILGDTFKGGERARAIGRNAAVLTASLAIFPLVGGALTTIGGWRLAFAPCLVAFVVAIGVIRILPADRPSEIVPSREQARGSASLSPVAPGAHDGRNQRGRVHSRVRPGPHRPAAAPRSCLRARARHAGPRSRAPGGRVRSRLAADRATRARWGAWTLVIAGFVCYAAAFGGIALVPSIGLAIASRVAWGVGEALTIVPLQTLRGVDRLPLGTGA